MSKNLQTIILLIVIGLVLIPTGAVVANHVIFNRYSTLDGEGCAAYSICMLNKDEKIEEKTPPIPQPISKDCKCNGTKKERTGDGILLVGCRCGSSCTCGTGLAPKTTKTTSVNLLVFGAKWCGPCKQMYLSTEPALRKTGWTFGPGKNIQVIDVDLDAALAAKYSVASLPCIIRLEDGKETNKYVGYVNAGGFTRLWEGKDLFPGDRLYQSY